MSTIIQGLSFPVSQRREIEREREREEKGGGREAVRQEQKCSMKPRQRITKCSIQSTITAGVSSISIHKDSKDSHKNPMQKKKTKPETQVCRSLSLSSLELHKSSHSPSHTLKPILLSDNHLLCKPSNSSPPHPRMQVLPPS